MKNLVAFLFLVLFISCKKETSGNGPGDEFVNGNVSYGNDQAQRMDVFLPAERNATSTKFMVLFHGGGWKDGDKSEYTIFIDSLRKRFPDWAFFNVNYRLYKDGNNVFPTQENDVKAAVEFILSRSEEYRISKSHVLMGASAGAHLALLQAYKNSSVQPKVVVSFFGPTDLNNLYQATTDDYVKLLLAALTGTTPDLHSDIYQKSSPINYVSATSCPTLILHGTRDQTVPIGQSQMLKTKLDQHGVANKLVIYQGQGHGWLGTLLTDSFNQVESFIKEHVQ